MSISEHEAKVLSDFEAYEAEVATLRARAETAERQRDGLAQTISIAARETATFALRVAELERELEGMRQRAIREYLAEHGGDAYKAPARTAHLPPSAEPTPRDMRVAELERELEGMRQRAHAAEAQRDEAVSRSHESLTESVRAKADAARLREALERYGDHHPCCDYAERALYEDCACGFRDALASAPSAEPTPRDMRVAEAVAAEWFDAAWKLGGEQAAKDARCTIDLAAVVAKAVGT